MCEALSTLLPAIGDLHDCLWQECPAGVKYLTLVSVFERNVAPLHRDAAQLHPNPPGGVWDATEQSCCHAGLHAVLLPEMAFSGYTFKNRESVAPMLEVADDGPTFAWCQMHARRLRCSVVCGFPRRHTQVALAANAFPPISPPTDA